MNYRLVSWLLGIVSLMIGVIMLFSLPWANPALGVRNESDIYITGQFETRGFLALLLSVFVCLVVGGGLMWMGRKRKGQLFRKEAMAVVGLSWLLASVLGAFPYVLSQTHRGPALRLNIHSQQPAAFQRTWLGWGRWHLLEPISPRQMSILRQLLIASARGCTADDLAELDRRWQQQQTQEESPPADWRSAADILREMAKSDAWAQILLIPGNAGPPDRIDNFRVRFVRMSLVDAVFESQSGFSTTGATVISDLEDPYLVPHCILFWRSSTHFLGGLGIIVLFVAVLGQGSAGKALMCAELPGPSMESVQARMQHAAWTFGSIYLGLTAVLTIFLRLFGLTWFDALCHSFGTMATGGFSTYNASLGHFDSVGIDCLVILFMILAGTNFTLLYMVLLLRPGAMFRDVEWRTYMSIILVATILILVFGLLHQDFHDGDESPSFFAQLRDGLRYGLFQVVSIMTTTGYGTHDFDIWNHFGRATLLLLMFVGGCAGSTGGGLKVIRHVLFFKVLRLEIEHAFHPTVVRPLRIAGRPVDDPELRHSVLVYFGMILGIFVLSWLFLLTTEPDATWAGDPDHKLIDTASAVAATLNNIGPGLGTVGSTQNYGHFSWPAKALFTWLMMLGRVEVYVILCLFVPRFWRRA